MSLTLSCGLLKKYPTSVFVETGTFNGDAIQVALDAGYKTVHSIEIFAGRVENARERFAGVDGVQIYSGRSKDLLAQVIAGISEPITFWLDAHTNLEETPTDDNAPLLDELEIIAWHPVKNHVLLIDDMRLCGQGNWRYVTRKRVIAVVMAINPKYEIEFVDSKLMFSKDILVAHVPG